jgi:exodeoxyribonuclease VII large subunit
MVLKAKIENLGRLLYRAGLTRLLSRKQTMESLDRQLQALNPNRILERGYSITFRKRDQKMIRSIKDIRSGDVLITRLCDGKVESLAKDPDQPELFS